MILRLAGLKRLPTPRTLGRWLRRFRIEHVNRLLRVNDELVADAIRQAGLRRLTLDVDGTVIRENGGNGIQIADATVTISRITNADFGDNAGYAI